MAMRHTVLYKLAAYGRVHAHRTFMCELVVHVGVYHIGKQAYVC